MATCFQFFGHFHWPPIQVDRKFEPNPNKIQSGVVCIQFSATTGNAYLTWLPKEIFKVKENSKYEEPGNELKDNIYTMEEKDRTDLLTRAETEAISVWINRPTHLDATSNHVHLIFRGGFLFDQISTDTPLRWPLQLQNNQVYSELIIGYKKNATKDYFLFNLLLITPKPNLGTNSGTKVFKLSICYKASANTKNEIYKLSINNDLKSFNQKKLGDFGFTYKRNNSSFFAQDSTFWPKDIKDFNSVIERLGLKITRPNDNGIIDFENERSIAIYFPKQLSGESPPASTQDLQKIIYRIALKYDYDKYTNTGYQLYLPNEVGGWLNLNSGKIYADLELHYTITDKDIWDYSNLALDLRPIFSVRLWWEQEAKNSARILGTTNPNTLSLLEAATNSMRLARQALQSNTGTLAQSLLPELSLDNNNTVRFCLYATELYADLQKRQEQGFHFNWSVKKSVQSKLHFKLSIANPKQLLLTETTKPNISSAHELNLTVRFPSFDQSPRNKLEKYKIHFLHDDKIIGNDVEDYFASFSIISPPQDKFTKICGRLAALKFDLITNLTRSLLDATSSSSLKLFPRKALLDIGSDGKPETFTVIGIDLTLHININGVMPFTVDKAPDDRSPYQALLIPLNPDDASAGTFVLKTREMLSGSQDYLLEADIILLPATINQQKAIEGLSTSGTPSPSRSYVVLSEAPFSIVKFSMSRLAELTNPENAIIATFSSTDRLWNFKQVSDYYHYIFPPQSIGESMDKPRRLEIHDALDKDDIRPFINNNDDKNREFPLKRKAVEFRLTPSAELWIKPCELECNYSLPQWNHLNIFRRQGDFGMGAALHAFRGEFLYGIPVGLDVASEKGSGHQARVAEIEALLGVPPDAQPVDATRDQELNERWQDVRNMLSRRPERLEFWTTDNPDTQDRFTPARFTNPRFVLRETALHRHPVKDEQDVNSNSDGGDINKPRIHPQGLSGGALWPIESNNIFEQLRLSPYSSGGSIEGIALGPLGGDANQKAEFLQGIVTISSETRNGFLQRLQVEITGRIAVVWNRAKHVVVYERSVNASSQFAPLQGTKRSRRPILRKSSEYIEIVEVERRYPDFSAASMQSCGHLYGVRFNSKIIHVDSAWGSDVGKTAWQVPLWNRNAARVNSQVYSQPDIVFITHAEGEGTQPTTVQECLDQDNLYFYTDVGETTNDTNAWKAYLSIDYANLPAAGTIACWLDDDTPSPTDNKRKASVSRILPGLRRFTWRLAPSSSKTIINAGRGNKPIFAGLESITFMRANVDVSANINTLNSMESIVKSGKDIRKLDNIPELTYWGNSVPTGTSVFGDFPLKFSEFYKVVSEIGNDQAIKNAYEEAIKAKDNAFDPQNSLLQQLFIKINTEITEKNLIVDPKELLEKTSCRCQQLGNDTVGMIRRKQLLITQNIQSAMEEFIQEKSRLEKNPVNLKEQITAAIDEAIKPLFIEVNADIGNIRNGMAVARSVVKDIEADIEISLQRALTRIEAIHQSYDVRKPWSINRLARLEADIHNALSTIVADAEGALDEARQRLATELDSLCHELGTLLAKELALVLDSKNGLLKELSRGKTILTIYFQETGNKLENLMAIVTTSKKRVDAEKEYAKNDPNQLKIFTDLIAVLEAAEDILTQAKPELDTLSTLAYSNIDEIKSLISKISSQVQGIIDTCEGAITSVADLPEDFSEFKTWVRKSEFLGTNHILEITAYLQNGLIALGEKTTPFVNATKDQLKKVITDLSQLSNNSNQLIDDVAADINISLIEVENLLKPEKIYDNLLKNKIITPCLDRIFFDVPNPIANNDTFDQIELALRGISTDIQSQLSSLSTSMLDGISEIQDICKRMEEGAQQIYDYFQGNMGEKISDKVNKIFAEIDDHIQKNELEELKNKINRIDRDIRKISNDLSRSFESAKSYADKVLHEAGSITKGGVFAAPNNILRLYSAAISSPQLAALETNIDRLRCNYDDLNNLINTTKANVLFGKLGDGLKALGLSFPFDGLNERFKLNISTYQNLNKYINCFAGLDVSKMLPNTKILPAMSDAIHISHDFNKQEAKAWVQIDLNFPLPERSTLFSAGIFKLDLVDSHLLGKVRLDASKDTDKVQQSGYSRLDTDIEVVVSGQLMVSLQKVAITYSKEDGLKVDLDPKNIKLSPSFKFIQDTLGSLFGDEIGGLKIIKEGGIPIGVEHEFNLPSVSLMYGTSGVSNIQISNYFRLIAYPNFIVSNRFNLSRPELPFIFSIFIIGGTGYIQVDTEYRPFTNQLMVVVTAAAGGSAALGFAFGPVTGSVFITLSVALAYCKTVEQAGGGLTVSLILLIAGNVSIGGIISVYIGLLLSIIYRDNGQVDATGTLIVKVQISRFFTIQVRQNVQYKLRDGQSKTTITTTTEVSTSAVNKLTNARGQL